MARRLPKWVVKSLAPWSIGACLLISFTASAGPRTDYAEILPVRSSILSLTSITLSAPGQLSQPLMRERASRANERPETPSFASWIVQPPLDQGLTARSPEGPQPLMFLDYPELLPTSHFHAIDRFEASRFASSGVFSQQTVDGSTFGGIYGDVAPNRSSPGSSPTSLASLTASAPDGGTPTVPRAVSLASSTPAPVEPQIVTLQPRINTPVASAPAARPPVVAAVKPAPPRASYADLIDPEDMNKEQRCLAEAVYFEARSESPDGQAAVAQVVLNRVKSGLYPDSVCGVVYQNRHRYMACQFSFACEGKSLRVTEPGPWKQAVKIARNVTFGDTYLHKVGNALNYHANYVKPSWRHLFRKADTIGTHIFYRPKGGPT